MNENDGAFKLYNELIEIYIDVSEDFSCDKINKTDFKYNPINLAFDTYYYKRWFQESDDSTVKGGWIELGNLPSLESKEDVQKEKD